MNEPILPDITDFRVYEIYEQTRSLQKTAARAAFALGLQLTETQVSRMVHRAGGDTNPAGRPNLVSALGDKIRSFERFHQQFTREQIGAYFGVSLATVYRALAG